MAGILGDQIGPFNAILSVLVVGLMSVIACWLQSSYSVALLYLFAAIFGLSSGGALSLEPLCIGRLCPVHQFGQYYGTCYLVVAAL
jgi:MFS family permease